ncbi:MAG: alpha/beta fold hydrolase [Chryseolinea sp.]
MIESKIQIPSRDGLLLDSILLEAESNPKGVVQLAGGTGIKKEFYLNFARYLCEQGYHVLLFDYRGIGGSKPKSLRGFKALNHEWGQKDMAAILDWLTQRYNNLPTFLIGHSAGGQQLGMMDNHHRFSKALLISCSTGYWKWLSSPYKYFTLFIWQGLAPIMLSTVGYLPASWFGLGEDLPKGVAAEWRSWCMNQQYFGKYFGTTIQKQFYSEVKIPLHFLFPEDDTIATDRTVQSLRGFYSEAFTSVEKIMLEDHKLRKIGHLGFFSRKVKEKLWNKALIFLANA